ncbi:response regulator [Oleiagrimonas soli]|uniref:CheY-like chemotaxis protein n=1 Tax=Oleiagrimonas soli TaxID=1543381 RepID=A0A099CU24_9GAMM|nr:response regulator [Oleiagrimonas soli]KGI77458.1 hypothetical protein LF63_0108865 [Oleiagrimonas soli]MBB6183096.1 CheY-like chemotaxis protein [Oleiagrimonas soli]
MSDVVEAPAARACVLLAEDDPVSALFLAEALRSLGLDVDACDDGLLALARARVRRYDLLLLDCRLPGLGAQGILGTLAADATMASHGVPAIASSAEMTAAQEHALHAQGFARVLRKPMQVQDLEQALTAVLAGAAPLLDEAAALEASGDARTLEALRGLFQTELETLSTQFDTLLDDHAELRERLHRLRASCGFCGATPLSHACERLASADIADAATDPRVKTFRERLTGTLQALRERTAANA